MSPTDVKSQLESEIRQLHLFLREEERIQRQLQCDIAAIGLWKQAPRHSKLSRWISDVALEGRHRELTAVRERVLQIRANLTRLTLEAGSEVTSYVESPATGTEEKFPSIQNNGFQAQTATTLADEPIGDPHAL
jgi:hypothetical protein